MSRATSILVLLAIASACGTDSGSEADPEIEDTVLTGFEGKGDEFAPSKSTVRVDRMGHVELGPLIIADMPTADAFNQLEPYSSNMTPAERELFSGALQAGLIKYDNYDSFPLELLDWDVDALEHVQAGREGQPTDPSRLDWIDSLDQAHPLLEVYLTDALYLDLSKPCGPSNYLEPEVAVMMGAEPQTCGGRHINEDVLDRFATLLINGPVDREVHPDDDKELDEVDTYPDRGDSVTEPARPATDVFPYLAEPYTRFLFQ